MAEKKGVGHAYNVDFLNVVFAASSLFLFLSVVWMVWDDYDREWKNTQRRFSQLEYQVTQAQLQQASRSAPGDLSWMGYGDEPWLLSVANSQSLCERRPNEPATRILPGPNPWRAFHPGSRGKWTSWHCRRCRHPFRRRPC